VKYTNYKRFGSKSRIVYEGKEVPKGVPKEQKPDEQQAQQAQQK